MLAPSLFAPDESESPTFDPMCFVSVASGVLHLGIAGVAGELALCRAVNGPSVTLFAGSPPFLAGYD